MWKPELKPYNGKMGSLRQKCWDRIIELGKKRTPREKGICWDDHGLGIEDIRTVLQQLSFSVLGKY